MKLTKPRFAPHLKRIKAEYDADSEWRMDRAGYFLIKLRNGKIEAGFCKKNNLIEKIITGKTAEEICMTVIRENITKNPAHLAYLGRELEKAEIALTKKINYVQDSDLVFVRTM